MWSLVVLCPSVRLGICSYLYFVPFLFLSSFGLSYIEGCVCVNMYVISSHLLVGFLTVTFKKYNFY